MAQDVVSLFDQSSKMSADQDLVTLTLPCIDLGYGHLFGGQAFAQAGYTASCWLESYAPNLHLHTCHGLFLKAGTAYKPVEYQVRPIGFGRTFQRLEIKAFQQAKLVFQAFASAQRPETAFLEHELPMPIVPAAEVSMSLRDLKQKLTGIDPPENSLPLDVRVATPEVYLKAVSVGSVQGFWFRYQDPVQSLTPSQCKSLLAFASDYGFLGSLFVSHSPKLKLKPHFITSLDHTLWYYSSYKPFEWAYFESESPVAQGGRGLVVGRFYQNDRLLAVATQEGLLRRRD